MINMNENIETRAKIHNAIGHKNRLTILQNINDKNLEQIAEICGVKRTSLQPHTRVLVEVGLIKKVGGGYRRTEIGDKIIKEEYSDSQNEIVQDVMNFKKEEIRMAVLSSPLSVNELENLIKEAKKRKR